MQAIYANRMCIHTTIDMKRYNSIHNPGRVIIISVVSNEFCVLYYFYGPYGHPYDFFPMGSNYI